MKRLSNVSVRDFRKSLAFLGLSPIRSKGGHEMWGKAGMTRPVVFQTHKDPVPELVILNNIRNMGLSKEKFLSVLEKV